MRGLDIIRKQRRFSFWVLLPWVRNRISTNYTFLLCLFALTLFTAELLNNKIISKLRFQTMDEIVSLTELINIPAKKIKLWVGSVKEYRNFVKIIDNKTIEDYRKSESDSLLIKVLRSENEQLKKLLNFLPPAYNEIDYIATRIVGEAVDGRSAFIAIGSEDGVIENQAVVNDQGLVGKIINVGRKSARILFITDHNSRVPVITTQTYAKAIAVGSDGYELKLKHKSDKIGSVVDGELVITAGDNKFFPAGIQVGYLKDSETVIPQVDFQQIDFVSIVKIKGAKN